MSSFLEQIFSWKPFKGKRRRSSRDSWFGGDSHVGRGARPSIPRRELFVAAPAGLNLMLLPWLVGGISANAQWCSFGLSCLAFAFLFLPVGYDEWRSDSPKRSLERLLDCNVFWCGVALFSLFLLHGLNPRFSVELDGSLWQLMPENPTPLMPSGVAAPFTAPGIGGMNAWRTALIFSAPFLTFFALWTGVRSRRVVNWLVRAVLASCVCLGLFAIGMRAGGESLLYGSIPVSVGSVYGPFTYQNQAGVFFYMAFLLAAAQAMREWRVSAGAGLRGGSQFVFAAAACLLAAAAVFSASFAAVGGVAAGLVVILPAWWFSRPRVVAEGYGSRASLVVVFLLISALVAGIVFFSDLEPVWRKLMNKFSLINESKVDDRSGLREATWSLYRESSALFGSGAGSFRWVALQHFAKVPAFCNPANGELLFRADYAHCDWLQFLAEWGAVGLVSAVSFPLWFFWRLWDSKFWKSAVVWPVMAAIGLVVFHACIDFLFFNPSVILFTSFVAFVALSWARELKPRDVKAQV